MAIDVSWTAIADGQVDADSPLNQILMQAIKNNLYHLELWLGKNYTAANDHDHDNVNSKSVVLGTGVVTEPKLGTSAATQTKIAASAVGQEELKTSSGSVSVSSQPFGIMQTLPGGNYGYYPTIKISSAAYYTIAKMTNDNGTNSLSYIPTIALGQAGGVGISYAQQYYVTASGEIHWLFMLMDRSTGKQIATWQCTDHPCFGARGISHPFLDYDPDKHEILVVAPDLMDVHDIMLACIPAAGGGYMDADLLTRGGVAEDWSRPEIDFMEVFFDKFDVLESQQTNWPDTEITIGLPRIHNGELVTDWRFMPRYGRDGQPLRVDPVKAVIPRPDYITPIKYRRKTVIEKL
jgi:hypothetical protein